MVPMQLFIEGVVEFSLGYKNEKFE